MEISTSRDTSETMVSTNATLAGRIVGGTQKANGARELSSRLDQTLLSDIVGRTAWT